MGLATKIADYKASKATLFWTAVGASVVTATVGFSGLGWTTATVAEKATLDAVNTLRVEVASNACFDTFMESDDVAALQDELTKLNAHKAETRIGEMNWVPGDIATSNTVSRKATKACLAMVRSVELPEAVVELPQPVLEPHIAAPEVVVVPAIVEPAISEPAVVVVPEAADLEIEVKSEITLPEITLPEVVIEPATSK